MIEMFIIAAIVSSVTLRVAGNVAVDGFFALRGQDSPRYTRAKARRTSGAATRYWSEVWDDVWTGMSAKRAARKSGGTPDRTPKPRGAATRFIAGLARDGRRAAGRRWDEGWTSLDERRRTKATRPRPGQVTVPGTVVPNAEDEDGDRPQDRPVPEPRLVPDEDGRTDLRFGEDGDDPTGVSSCPECGGTSITEDGEICLSCRGRQEQRNQHHEEQDGPVDKWQVVLPNGHAVITDDPDNYRDAGYPVQPVRGHDRANGFDVTEYPTAPPIPTEGPTPMTITMPSADTEGFEPTIKWGETSAQGYRAMIGQVELAVSKLRNAEVTDEGIYSDLASVMDQTDSAARAMDSAMAKLAAHRIVAEALHAAPGAGKKEFMLQG